MTWVATVSASSRYEISSAPSVSAPSDHRQYFDGVLVDHEGTPEKASRVICLHEQDNGIGWKHTNWRTGRAVTVRRRELVVQFIITLANYEYIFNVRPLFLPEMNML